MQQNTFYFKNSCEQDLYGVLHGASLNSDLGVIFCHPLGEEKQKSYRAYYDFSNYLLDKGIPSLRFDTRGNGDSDGEMSCSNIEAQVADTHTAVDILKDKTGVSKVCLIGARLGASIAALSAEESDQINGVVLLSPIVDGARYWRELLRTQQFSCVSRNEKPKKASELIQDMEKSGVIEIEAQLLSHAMVTQLKALDLTTQTGKFKGEVLTTAISGDEVGIKDAETLAATYETAKCSSQLWLGDKRDYWTNQSMYDAYSPIDTFEKVETWLQQWSSNNV